MLALTTTYEIFTRQTCFTNRGTVLFRPFSSYSFHDIVGSEYELNPTHHTQDHRMTLTVTPEYMQSWGKKCCKGNGSTGFGAYSWWSGTNELTIGKNDGLANIDGYNLGLGFIDTNSETGIAGKIVLNPKVQHVGTDIKLYYAHHKDERSFYFNIHAPIVAMMVNPNLCEPDVATPDSFDFQQQTTLATTTPANAASLINYANANYATPERRYESASHFFFGGINACDTMHGAINKHLQLNHGRISAGRQTVVRLADLSASFGYNIIANDHNLFGLGFKLTTPTGNLPQAVTILEPVVGRAGCWGVGGEMTGHFNIWKHESKDCSVHLDLQGEILHLIPNRAPQFRSFDLKANGAGSRYLLVQHYPQVINQNSAITASAPNFPFEMIRMPFALTPAINLTTLPVISRIAVEGSFAAQLKHIHKNWSFAVAGEVWGRSREKLSFDIDSIVALKLDSLNEYAVVGRQVGVYNINDAANLHGQTLIANLCEPLATINKSQDPIQLVGSVPNVTLPSGSTIPAYTLPEGIKDATDSDNHIPERLSDALDVCGAQAPSVVTGKVYFSAGHTWNEHAFTPSLTAFGGVEFTSNNSLPKMWSVGLSGNIQF